MSAPEHKPQKQENSLLITPYILKYVTNIKHKSTRGQS